MKVSVLMVTYNHREYLAEAVESALAQRTAFDYEIVIGEDCSTDGTREIVADYGRRFPGRVRPLLRERNLGPGRNFAGALQACRGQYVALLEGDDYWTCPDKLQRQVDFLEAHPECAMCGHFVRWIRGRDVTPVGQWPIHDPPAIGGLEDLLECNYVPTCSTVLRRGLSGSLPPWFCDAGNGDWALSILTARNGRIGFLHEHMATYRLHDQGLWTTMSYDRRMELVVRTRRRVHPLLNAACRRVNRRALAEDYLGLANHFHTQGDVRRSRRFVLKAVLADPSLRWFSAASRKRVAPLLRSKR